MFGVVNNFVFNKMNCHNTGIFLKRCFRIPGHHKKKRINENPV